MAENINSEYKGEAYNLPTDATGLLKSLQRYVKLETVDLFTVGISLLVVVLVLIALGWIALFFIGMGAVKTLTTIVGSEELSCYIVGGVLLLVMFIFYHNRKSWVENRIVAVLSESIINRKEGENAEK